MTKSAEVYRSVRDDHICPYGIKAKDLLKRESFNVEDHHLKSSEEEESFKTKHKVETTPQIFIEGKRVGGYDELVDYLGKWSLKQEGLSYQPIVAIFATSLLMALAAASSLPTSSFPIKVAELFIAFSMCVLGTMKLRDLYSFSKQFLGYDLLAQRVVWYAYVYPFVEVGGGAAMIAGWLTPIVAPAVLFIGLVGGISVFKAVYIDRRELKCACVGGDSHVPLGLISFAENLMMVLMATWMLLKPA